MLPIHRKNSNLSSFSSHKGSTTHRRQRTSCVSWILILILSSPKTFFVGLFWFFGVHLLLLLLLCWRRYVVVASNFPSPEKGYQEYIYMSKIPFQAEFPFSLFPVFCWKYFFLERQFFLLRSHLRLSSCPYTRM